MKLGAFDEKNPIFDYLVTIKTVQIIVQKN